MHGFFRSLQRKLIVQGAEFSGLDGMRETLTTPAGLIFTDKVTSINISRFDHE